MWRVFAAVLIALVVGMSPAGAAEFALTVVATAVETTHGGSTAPEGYEFRLATLVIAGNQAKADAALAGSQAEDSDGFPNAIRIETTDVLDRRLVVVLIDKATIALALVLPGGMGRLPLIEGATLGEGETTDVPDLVTVSGDGLDYTLKAVAIADNTGGEAAPEGKAYATIDLTVTNRSEQGVTMSLGSLAEIVEDGRFLYPAEAPTSVLSSEAISNQLYEPNLPVDLRLAVLVPAEAGHLELVVHGPSGAVRLPLDGKSAPVATPIAGPLESGLLSASLIAADWAETGTTRLLTVDIDLALTSDNPLEVVTIPDDLVSLVNDAGEQWLRQAQAPLRRPLKPAPVFGGGGSVLGGALQFVLPSGTAGPFKLRVDGVAPPILLDVPDSGGGAVTDLVLEEPDTPLTLTFERLPLVTGLPIAVTYSGMPGNTEDWLAIATAGSADDKYIEAVSLGGARAGRAIFNSFSEGEYELRAYFSWPDNGYRVEQRIPFTVSAAPPIVPGSLLKLPRPEITSSDPVTIVWDAFPGLDRDWISIAAVGTPDTSDGIDYVTLRGRVAGRLMFDSLPPGEYEARAYFNGGRTVQDRVAFKVSAPQYEHHIRDDASLPGLLNVAHLERGGFSQAGANHDLIIDGNAIDYGDESTFGRLVEDWPSRIWLARPFPIERARFLLWDVEPRKYRFILKGTSDGVTWVTLRDQADVPVAGGWQEVETGGGSFIGFSFESAFADGMENGFGLVEFAAYTSAATPDPQTLLPSGDVAEWVDRAAPVSLNVALPALGATADASWEGENAIDGRHDGEFAEVDAARPLTVTLPRPFPIETIRIESEDTLVPVPLRIEASADGTSFVTLSERFEPGDGLTEIDAGGALMQVVRVSPAEGGEAKVRVRELEMFASGPLPISGVAEALLGREQTAKSNLALAQNGGRIGAYSSERFDLVSAQNLIDGRPNEGWQTAQPKFPEEVVIVLGGRPGALIDAIDFYSANDVALPRLVDIALATETGEWSELGRYALSKVLPVQRVSFESREARTVRIRFVSSYHSDRVGLGEIAVREAKLTGIDSVSVTHWPGFEGGLNIAASALGGNIVSANPIDPDPNYPVTNLIDGYETLNGAWALDSDPSVAQVTIALPGEKPATIAGMAFNPDGGFSNFTGTQRWTSTVDVWASKEASDSGFEWVGRYRLDQTSETQVVSFAPREARYVRVLLLDTFGSAGAVMGEIEILEAPGPSITEDRPANLLDMSYGGHLAVPAGTNRSHLIDSTSASDGWYDQTGLRPVVLTFGFDGSAARTFDAVGLNPRTALDPSTWATHARIFVSDHPLRDFRPVADVEIEPVDRMQYFPIAATTARYVEVRLLDNGGDPVMSLGEVSVREAVPEGELSVLARRENPLAEAGEFETAIVPFTGAHAEQEPNNMQAEATGLPLGESMVGEIAPITDVDWYGFDMSGSTTGAVNARVEEQPQLQSELSLYAADGTVLGTQPLYDLGRPSADFTWLIAPKKHSLKLARAQNSIVFIVDRSGSVESVRGAIAQAAIRFAQNASPDDAISFATMDGEVINDFTTDKSILIEAARRTGTGSGGSGVYASLSTAIDRLKERKGAKAIVIVTDGEDSGSSMEPLFELWDKLRTANARIYTVGFGPAATSPLGGLLASTGGDMLREFSAATAGKFFLAPSGAAMRDIYARISRDLKGESGYRLTLSPALGTGQLQLVAEGEQITGVGAPRQVGLVFDASGSMKKELEGGVTRMEVARETLNALVDRLPDSTEVSLTVYGHRLPSKPHDQSCRDIETLLPFTPLDRGRMHAIIDAIKPRGETPIGRSLLAVAQSFDPASAKKFVILITDGEESCDPDPDDPAYPPKVISYLRSQGIELTLSIVGFAIGDDATRTFLQQLAEDTGGGYYDAADREALDAALKQAFSANFTAFDSLGTEAAIGRVGGEAVQLPAGLWHIVLQSDPSIDLGTIEVSPGATTKVVLTKEGDRLDVRTPR